VTLSTLSTTLRAQVRALDGLAGAVEALVLALTTRAAGWVACVPTIALTSRSCEMLFDLAPATAVASAISLEFVGQSVTANWLRAREWNNEKGTKSPPASEWLALAMVVGYFATDFALVAALQAPKARVEPVYWTALLFPLAQVISTLTTGQRAAQFRREADVEAASAKRSATAKEAAAERARRKAEMAEREAEVARIATTTRIAEAEAQTAKEVQGAQSMNDRLAFTRRQLAQIERVVAVHAMSETATLRDLRLDGLIGSDTTASRARRRAITGGYLVETAVGFSPNGRGERS